MEVEKKSRKLAWRDGGLFYSRWYYILLLLAVASLLIGYVFSLALNLSYGFLEAFVRSFGSTAVIWGGCMSIVSFTWKKFPWEQMPLKHLIIEVLLILLFLFLFIGLNVISMSYKLNIGCIHVVKSVGNQVVITLLITFLITTIHEAVFFYRQWKLHFSKSVSLERDNIQASYNMLKAQINPHFLFNSLNSLMTLVENNPKAEEYIQELSEFLRYVLVGNERELVSVQEEIEYLEKYIYLQKIRFGDNLSVDIQIHGEPCKECQIPPLILQMLFDNCIKHNVISVTRPLLVQLNMNEDYIILSNNLQVKMTSESTGQGLKNIEGRLKLLTARPVKIEKTETEFKVSVPLVKHKNND